MVLSSLFAFSLGCGSESDEGPGISDNGNGNGNEDEVRTKPTLDSVSPEVMTERFTWRVVYLRGSGFTESSKVFFDGEEVEATFHDSTSLSFTVYFDDTPVGLYEIYVLNDFPGGGVSETLTFRVAAALHFLEVEAVDERHVELTFSREVELPSLGTAEHPSFRITPDLEIIDVQKVEGEPKKLILETSQQTAGVEYELEILTGNIAHPDGGRLLDERERTFVGFGS